MRFFFFPFGTIRRYSFPAKSGEAASYLEPGDDFFDNEYPPLSSFLPFLTMDNRFLLFPPPPFLPKRGPRRIFFLRTSFLRPLMAIGRRPKEGHALYVKPQNSVFSPRSELREMNEAFFLFFLWGDARELKTPPSPPPPSRTSRLFSQPKRLPLFICKS